MLRGMGQAEHRAPTRGAYRARSCAAGIRVGAPLQGEVLRGGIRVGAPLVGARSPLPAPRSIPINHGASILQPADLEIPERHRVAVILDGDVSAGLAGVAG